MNEAHQPPKKKKKLVNALQFLSERGEKFMHLFNDSKKEKSIEPAKKSQRGQKRLREQVPIESSSTAHIAKPETSPKREEQVGGLGEALLKDKRQQRGSHETVFIASPKKTPSSSRQSGLSAAKSKRFFLSGRAALVHTDLKPGRQGRSVDRDQELQSSFSDMLREVESLGATGLDKKQQAKVEAERLVRLHAKPDKSPRIPASQAKVMLKKQATRKKEELEEAIASGMLQQKGIGKKKRRQKDQERKSNLGLYEDGGAFRNGLLDLRKLPSASKKKKWKVKKQK